MHMHITSRALPLTLAVLALGLPVATTACEAPPAVPPGPGPGEGEGEGEGEASEGEGEGEGEGGVNGVTYFADMKPLIEEKCLACHVEGGIAPFALTEPQDVVDMAGFLADTVESRVMPPWPPSRLSPPMRDDISLTDEQIALFRAFADAVALDFDNPPLGDPDDAPPPVEPQEFALNDVPPDVSAAMAEPFVPQGIDTGEDEFRCFVLDFGADALPVERMIIGQRFVPGNPLVDHHAILTLYSRDDLAAIQALDDAEEGAGWSCFGEDVPVEVAAPVGRVGAWTPGNEGVLAYSGTGQRIQANVIAVLSMHYNVANVIGDDGTVDVERAADQSTFELWFAPVETEGDLLQAFGLPFNLNARLRENASPIPANAAAHAVQDSVVIADARPGLRAALEGAGIDTVFATGAAAHGHLILEHFEIVANEGTADERVLLDIPAWDFDWQGQYTFVDALPLSIEDSVTVRCTYNNTSENRARVGLDPTSVEVVAGEGTGDEMCIGGVQFVLAQPQ